MGDLSERIDTLIKRFFIVIQSVSPLLWLLEAHP